ncbi:MAG: helix-turn-helix transcriptional regulator [Lachnospiraceae bacterium]
MIEAAHRGRSWSPLTYAQLEFETMRRNICSSPNDQLLSDCTGRRGIGVLAGDNLAIDRAEAYIRANYMRPITLAVVSNEVSLNYAYFSNSFKKQTGRTFSEYLRDIRLDAAKKLLRQPDIRISEVAERVGYDSYKSFYRAFKESSGMTPAEYQQKQYRRQD